MIPDEAVRLIPDSVQGAVTLSVIDFFLSFVVISGIGIVLSLFPYLNRVGTKLQETPVSVSVMPARDEYAEHAAVIGAAVFAMLGTHRLVRIGEAPARTAAGWTSQIRSRLHASHTPRRR
jgi:hypothetical protein